MSEEITKSVIVTNKFGIHARPAAKLVECASGFKSEITINKEGMLVNAKSIMELMTLGAACGTELTVKCCGDDAQEACSSISELLAGNFEVE